MYVIRLPNGNLRVPESAISGDGQLMSDAYVEIGPDDADYARLAEQAITEEELAERRKRWQEGDEPLRRQFMDFLARRGGGPADLQDGEDDWPS
jgi:post-segregation antitoxin (ccd killing protein)